MTTACRGCGRALPEPFLDLGTTPLANSYIDPSRPPADEPRFPLAVSYCPGCHLVQVLETVPPEAMFSEYFYFSSYSDAFLAHSKRMAEELSQRFGLGPESKVLEIASNDGYLLRWFQELGVRVLGVEPAQNIAKVAVERGIPTLNRFFGLESKDEILSRFGPADLVLGNNVMAHVPEIRGFLEAVKECLKPGGAAVFEFPHLEEFIRRTEFDTIYHEHVFYYSLAAVRNLAAGAGLEVFDAQRQAIHGGSLRVFLQRPGDRPVEPAVAEMLADEEAAGLTRAATYAEFRRKVERLRGDLVALLRRLKAEGKRVAAYGAPAKGNTLLNYCGIGRDLVEFTVDRSPHKQGKLLPGTRIPIRAAEELAKERPDYALLLPWNFAEEIVQQQEGYLLSGGRFILPIPTPTEIGS